MGSKKNKQVSPDKGAPSAQVGGNGTSVNSKASPSSVVPWGSPTSANAASPVASAPRSALESLAALLVLQEVKGRRLPPSTASVAPEALGSPEGGAGIDRGHEPARATSQLSRKRSAASLWSAHLEMFRCSSTLFEAAAAMRDIEESLAGIEEGDRIAYCKGDFIKSYLALVTSAHIDASKLREDFIRILRTYFKEDRVNDLPEMMLQIVFSFLDIKEMPNIMCACKQWNNLGLMKPLWQDFYIRRFPTVSDEIPSGTETVTPVDGDISTANVAATHSGVNTSASNAAARRKSRVQAAALSIQTLRRSNDCAALFRARIVQPMATDRLQVLWKGRFRTRDDEVVYALSWWAADVLARKGRTYRIRYPGWGARWVEDVPRARLRWPPQALTCAEPTERGDPSSIKVGSIVEVRFYVGTEASPTTCVWAVTEVYKIRKGRYAFENLSEDGILWVPRDRIREASFSPASCTREQMLRLMAQSEQQDEAEAEARAATSPSNAGIAHNGHEVAVSVPGRGSICSIM